MSGTQMFTGIKHVAYQHVQRVQNCTIAFVIREISIWRTASLKGTNIKSSRTNPKQLPLFLISGHW